MKSTQDPLKNIRKSLNFGHTLGHALKVIFLRIRIKQPYYMVKPLLWYDFRKLYLL
jgi:hypothetical protein